MPVNVKVRLLTQFLEAHGWTYKNTEGDHHHYRQRSGGGKVTIVGSGNRDVGGMLLSSILKQAGLTLQELREWLKH